MPTREASTSLRRLFQPNRRKTRSKSKIIFIGAGGIATRAESGAIPAGPLEGDRLYRNCLRRPETDARPLLAALGLIRGEKDRNLISWPIAWLVAKKFD